MNKQGIEIKYISNIKITAAAFLATDTFVDGYLFSGDVPRNEINYSEKPTAKYPYQCVYLPGHHKFDGNTLN